MKIKRSTRKRFFNCNNFFKYAHERVAKAKASLKRFKVNNLMNNKKSAAWPFFNF